MFRSHDGAEIFTTSFGSGGRVFAAQGGWTGSWELWTGVMGRLSASWRTVAWDHRGCGATLADPESITHDRLVSDLFAVLNALRVERCVLAGESAGAGVVLRAALQHPERFEGLVLVDALYFNPEARGETDFMRALRADYAAALGGFVDACVLENEPNSAAARRWGRMILARSSVESAVRLLACTQGLDLRAQVSQIRLPTLILHGSEDRIVPPASSQWLAGQIQNSRLRILDGAGHVPTVTREKEVADEINDFFRPPLS